MNKIICGILISPLFFIHNALAQQKRPTSGVPSFKCTTYVYNLTNEKMQPKDICVYVSLTNHFDMNDMNLGQKWDRKNDLWKYNIEIFENAKNASMSIHRSFYVAEESDSHIQYHCLQDDGEVKALIYNKSFKNWSVLLFQNDEYKILSPYTGYYYTNYFGIKPKKSSSSSLNF